MWWHEFFDDDALWLFAPTLHAERTEREVEGAVRLLRLKSGQNVLDLGCGGGRHAAALTRRGMPTTGVEWSPPALGAAARRFESLDLPLTLVRGDLRTLPVASATFDVAISLFSTLGYESDDDTRAFLAEAKRALKPGGKLLVEVLGRDAAVRKFHATQEWSEVDGRPVRIRRWLDLVAGEERATFFYDRGSGPREKEFRRRIYTPTELANLLKSAGFARLDWFGDYDGAALRLDSPHLIGLARAP